MGHQSVTRRLKQSSLRVRAQLLFSISLNYYANILRFQRETEVAPSGEFPLIDIAKYFDATNSAYVITVRQVRRVTIESLLLLDEAAHHLRSALDYLVFALALADSGAEQQRTQFPLLTEPEKWDTKRTRDEWLAGISDDHRRMIETYQPYHPCSFRGESVVHPLKTLNDLDNDNKHALLQEAYLTLNALRITPGVEKDCRWATPPAGFSDPAIIGRPLYADTELGRVPVVITGPQYSLEIGFYAEPYIAFRNGIGCADLRRAAAYVRRIIREFTPRLSDPETVALWGTVERRFKVEPKPVLIIARFVDNG